MHGDLLCQRESRMSISPSYSNSLTVHMNNYLARVATLFTPAMSMQTKRHGYLVTNNKVPRLRQSENSTLSRAKTQNENLK